MTALLALLMLLAAPLLQGDLDEAERAYRGGHFTEAHRLFLAALDRAETPSGELFYNLGNCAYRLGRPAEALWHWRRAQLRLPRNVQVQFNLERVAAELDVAILRATWTERISLAQWLLLAGVLQGLGLAGIVMLRGLRRRLGACAAVALGLWCTAAVVQRQWFPGPPRAVVLNGGGTLRVAPGDEAEVAGPLPPGISVRVVEATDRWARVRGRAVAGWTLLSELGVVE